MRQAKILFLLYYLFLGSHVIGQEREYTFQIQNLEADYIYFGAYYGQNRYLIDSVKVTSGSFAISNAVDLEDGMYFLQAEDFFLDVIVTKKEKSFQVEMDKEVGLQSLIYSGTEENRILTDFKVKIAEFGSRTQQLFKDYQKSAEEDSVALFSAFNKIKEDERKMRIEIYESYPHLLASAIIKISDQLEPLRAESTNNVEELNRRQYWHTREAYFNQIDLNNKALLRTPYLHNKVMTYFYKVLPQNHDTISVAIDAFLEKVENEVCYDYWLKSFFDHYNKSTRMGMEGVMVHLAEKYIINNDRVEGISPEQISFLRSEISFLKPNLLGRPAPALHLKDTLLDDSNPLTLESEKLILFFYDPDCEHCQEKTDALKKNMDDLRSERAEIIAICVNTDIEQWRKYIIYKNIEVWINLSDPHYESDFREKYNVRSVPKIFILDEKRHIIGKDLDANQLLSFLKKLK